MIRPRRPARNRGRIVGQKRPPAPGHVWAIRVRLGIAERIRDLAPFNPAIDSKLRGGDLARLKVSDPVAAGRIEEGASVFQRRTGRPVRFQIAEGARASPLRWIEQPAMIGSAFPWSGRLHGRLHVSTRQDAGPLKGRVVPMGLEPSACGAHSMRRTRVARICRKTDDLRAAPDPL